MKKLFLISIILLSFILTASLKAEVLKKDFKTDPITELKINNTSGIINVIGSTDKTASVTVDKVKMHKKCKMTIDNNKGTLFIEIKNKSLLGTKECKTNLTVHIPYEANIDVKSGSGDIKIKDSKAKIKFRSGSGDVEIEGLLKEIDGKVGSGDIKVVGKAASSKLSTGSGDIRIEGLSSKSDLSTGSGDIFVKATEIDKNGDLTIKSGSGDATIYLPSESKILTDFNAGSGKIHNEFGDSNNPEMRISFKAGSGDLSIKKIQ